MSGYVCVDASVAAKWVLDESLSDTAADLYHESQAADVVLVGPPHMNTEVANAIWRRAARGEFDQVEAERLMQAFLGFVVEIVSLRGLHLAAMKVAGLFNRPAIYDAHYVALARMLDCDLWTADKRLLNALNGRLPFVKSLADYQ